jgi:hypothetical protein
MLAPEKYEGKVFPKPKMLLESAPSEAEPPYKPPFLSATTATGSRDAPRTHPDDLRPRLSAAANLSPIPLRHGPDGTAG